MVHKARRLGAFTAFPKVLRLVSFCLPQLLLRLYLRKDVESPR